jgi:signal transduction histidine kinase
MNIPTDAIRAEPHVEVGELIERNVDVLLEQWCYRAIDEQATAKRVHADVLRDDLAKFLRAIGLALKTEGALGRRQAKSAGEHGEQRWDTGWSLAEVIRDYQLLQVVILEFLEDMLRRPLHQREMLAIGVFIDDAIAASVNAYVAQREAEVVRVEQEKLKAVEEASRHKDEFMAILGHELRNPLAPIQNSVRILRMVLKSSSETAVTAVDVIERQSKHLVRLVDDILDLANIGQGRLELRKTRLDLAAILERAAETVEPLVKEREHELTLSLPTDAVAIDADPDRLMQIVCNLLNNAVKYTPRGGRIALSGALCNGEAVIRVRDNGIGIPQDMLSNVFAMFSQTEEAKEYSQGGLGLGLALVQRLVQEHGGTVACHSAGRGQGSEFVVRLPAAGAAVAVAAIAPVPVVASGLRIVKTDTPKAPSE